MTRLGDTTARLAKLQRQMQAAAAAPAAAQAADGRMTEVRTFGKNPGALRMLSYAPGSLPRKAALVVVLHGCTQRAGAFAEQAGWLTLADRHGFCVVAPEQTPANNPNRCFNWFQPGDTARGQGESASIHAMVRHAIKTHDLDPERVFVTGLSAGGAMTSVMLAAYPDTFTAGAVVAGLPYGAAANVQEALRAMHGGVGLDGVALAALVRAAAPAGRAAPRLSVWHGEADGTVNVHNGHAVARQWAAVHSLSDDPHEREVLPGRTRSTWRAAGGGQALIELNLIAGLGHGAPLSAAGPDGLGAAAPFMLEAGISSSLEIARFWGLAPPADPAEPAQVLGVEAEPALATADLGAKVMATLSGRLAPDLQGVIAKALKTAGLMK